MDMTPPQAPPALVEHENRQAIAAFQVLVTTQQWLLDERRDMPAPADAVEGGDRQAFLRALRAFWAGTSHDSALSRRAAWADAIARAMRALATLREADGTLDPAAAALARRVAASRATSSGPAPTVSRIIVGDHPYTGALVTEHDGITLMFTPDHGWETAADLDDAHATLERRIRRAHAAGIDLPGMTRRALLDVVDTPFVGSRRVDGNPFDALVADAIDHQHRQLTEAWLTHAALPSNAAHEGSLVDAIGSALQPDTLLDIEAILAVRDTLLVESVQEARLSRVPTPVAESWTRAWEDHLALLQGMPGDDTEVVSAAVFATTSLRGALQQAGVVASPDDITVTLDRSADPAARLASLAALFEGGAPVTMKLTDLAWQNMAAFDPVRLSASDGDGHLIQALSDNALRSLVRRIDLFTAYRRYLTDLLRDGDNARIRKDRAIAMQRSWMRIQANEARLSYTLPEDPRSLRDDHSERGYRWIEAVLDAPAAAQRRKVEGHDVVVRQVTYRGKALTDIIEIGAASTESVPGIVLYTPDAPDGIAWREFDDRMDAGRRFFYHPRFREYLLDRLPSSFAVVASNGQARSFNVDRRAWVFGGSGGAGYTQTGEPFQEADVTGDFLAARYEASVNLAIENTATFGRSAADARWDALVTNATLQQQIVGRAVLAAITAPFRAPGAAWRFYDDVKAGDSAQAFVDFAEFYNHSLTLMPLYSLGRPPALAANAGLRVGAIAEHARFRAGPSALATSTQRAARTTLDPRYRASHVRKEGQPDSHGLYTIKGQAYLEHGGDLYAARWDASFDTVRLRQPGAGTTGYGPAVRRATDAHWANQGVGLRGGGGHGILRRMLGHDVTPPAPWAGLQAWEQSAFQRNLDFEIFSRIPHAPSRLDLLRQVEEGALQGRAPTLSATQADVWREASRAAYDTVMASRRSLPAPNPSGAFDFSARPAPVAQAATTSIPSGYRLVPRAEAPATLYVVDRLPYKRSAFQRELVAYRAPGLPYSNQRATLLPSTHAQGISGVRVTTLTPSTPLDQFGLALGSFPSRTTFMVRLNTRRVIDNMATARRELQVLEVEGTGGTVFVLRTADGKPVELSHGDFAPPVMWSGR